MESMFHNCTALQSLDTSNWNTSKVTTMLNTFNSCYALTQLNLSNWSTTNLTNLRGMLYSCSGLTTIGDISNWNTSNVTNMSNIFCSCVALTSLDVSGWNTSNVTTMEKMFHAIPNVQLKLGANFIMTQNPTTTGMFTLNDTNTTFKSRSTINMVACPADTQTKITALTAA